MLLSCLSSIYSKIRLKDVTYHEDSKAKLEKLVILDLPPIRKPSTYPNLRTGNPLVVENTIYLPVTLLYTMNNVEKRQSIIYSIDTTTFKVRKRLVLNDVKGKILPPERLDMNFRHVLYNRFYSFQDKMVQSEEFIFAVGKIGKKSCVIQMDRNLNLIRCMDLNMDVDWFYYADWFQKQIRVVGSNRRGGFDLNDFDPIGNMTMKTYPILKASFRCIVERTDMWFYSVGRDSLYAWYYDLNQYFPSIRNRYSYHAKIPHFPFLGCTKIGNTLHYSFTQSLSSTIYPDSLSTIYDTLISVNLETDSVQTLHSGYMLFPPMGIKHADKMYKYSGSYTEDTSYAAIDELSDDLQHSDRKLCFRLLKGTHITGLYPYIDDKLLIFGETMNKYIAEDVKIRHEGYHSVGKYNLPTLYLGVVALP